jgi:hypothetical protein
MEKLFEEAKLSYVDGIIKTLRRLVPEFKPVHYFKAAPPSAFRRMRPDIFPVAEAGKSAESASVDLPNTATASSRSPSLRPVPLTAITPPS